MDWMTGNLQTKSRALKACPIFTGQHGGLGSDA